MVRTRFAPSPTGYLHIGGVRTALFNYLFSRKHGGQFLLRIDDTDQARNVEAALAPILHGFRWLGIQWDEGPEVGGPYAPYYQSQRSERYQAAVDKLLASGHAYRDYATTAEIQAEREAADKEKRPFIYSRRWMAEMDAQRKQFEAEGRSGVVRLNMPHEGTLVIRDLVRGDVEFEWAREQDHVIQRADGTCLYHLASVVDDRDFEITHVIRAEEHLSNTPRQIFIAQSLGYELPEYAHLPYVAEPGSKSKLSKRKLDKYLKNPDFARLNEHGQTIAHELGLATSAETFNPVIVDFYEQVGYLPDAIVNYLMLLGWSLDDKTEFLTRQQMIDHFTLDRVVKSPASFDPKKLWAFQDHYMQQLPVEAKAAGCLPFLRRGLETLGYAIEPELQRIEQLVRAAGDRIKVSGDVLDYVELFLPDDRFAYEAAAFDKVMGKPQVLPLLEQFRAEVARLPAFGAASVEQALRDVLEATGSKIGDLIHAARVAVTGKSVGMGLFEYMDILGQKSSLARLDRAILEVSRRAASHQ